MTRPTPAELARYREQVTSGKFQFFSPGIIQQLLAEIDALRAEADERERAAWNASREFVRDAWVTTSSFRWRNLDDFKAAQAKEGE